MKAGIKVYVIVMLQQDWWEVNKAQPTIPIQMQGLDIVEMNDRNGLSRIRREIASMASSPLREEVILSRTSLVSYLVLPIVGMVALCLVLSETCFRRIP